MTVRRNKKVYEENGKKVTLITRKSGKKVKKTISADGGTKYRKVYDKSGKPTKERFRHTVDHSSAAGNPERITGKIKYNKEGGGYKKIKERAVDTVTGVKTVTKTRTTKSGNEVYKYKDSRGNKLREVRNPEGTIIKRKSKDNVTISGGGKPSTTGVERSKYKGKKDGSYKRKTVTNSGDGRKVFKRVAGPGGTIKKTVTKKPGAVEKEIERGNKRIEVDKYKDEGVKTRTVINMKKNEQYQNDLKGSTFKNFPQQVYDNAMKNKI